MLRVSASEISLKSIGCIATTKENIQYSVYHMPLLVFRLFYHTILKYHNDMTWINNAH